MRRYWEFREYPVLLLSRILSYFRRMKILIIEDEPSLRETMADSLRKEEYLVEIAENFWTGREKIGVYDYDCILLDIGLPGGDGFDLLEDLRTQGKADGVIIVSARDSINDRVTGLNLGADDYLPKPFHLAELTARVKSVIRRRRFAASHKIQCNELEIDTESRSVTARGRAFALNRKEFDILLYLVVNKDRLVNKTALAENVWGDYIDEMNSFDFIYSQIKNLRKKLKEQEISLQIQAIYGIGYKLVTH